MTRDATIQMLHFYAFFSACIKHYMYVALLLILSVFLNAKENKETLKYILPALCLALLSHPL